MAAREKKLDDMAADEARTTRNRYPHDSSRSLEVARHDTIAFDEKQ
jgi:hypothetical protein